MDVQQRQLTSSSERQWPHPTRRPSIGMSWHDLLFMHWPVPIEALTPHVPSGLTIDTFDRQAWLGVVPFRMSRIGPIGFRWLPGISAFPEINVRTYVTIDDKPGVWFFSLDATQRLAVWAARRFFHLPYYRAAITCEHTKGWIAYDSRRTDGDSAAAHFAARYRPIGDVVRTECGSIEHWLTARYCLYAADRKNRLYRGEIDHPPWPLQQAEAEVNTNTMTEQLGFALPNVEPLLHFASRVDVVAWRLKPL